MLFKLHFNNNLDDNFLKELKKKSKNTPKFNSKQYKLLSKIADENIKKITIDMLKYMLNW